MPQIAIYLDDRTARRLDEAADRDAVSRSSWVREAILERLDGELPASFYASLGAWVGDDEPRELLRTIREGPPQKERSQLE